MPKSKEEQEREEMFKATKWELFKLRCEEPIEKIALFFISLINLVFRMGITGCFFGFIIWIVLKLIA